MIQPIGYLKLHRELYSKPIWKQSTPEQKVVLMTLLAMAWFKPNEWEWKGEKFKTTPGQFVTSIQSIMDDCGKGISIQNVRSSLKRFEKLGFLTNRSTKQGRLITIANWALYQSDDDTPTKRSTKTQQRPNKDPTPKEEVKKERKKEFIPPTLLQIEEYILEKQYVVDPKFFFDYFEARDWINSKGLKVTRWKSNVVTWNRKELEKNPNAKPYKKKNEGEPLNDLTDIPEWVYGNDESTTT